MKSECVHPDLMLESNAGGMSTYLSAQAITCWTDVFDSYTVARNFIFGMQIHLDNIQAKISRLFGQGQMNKLSYFF